MVTSQDDIKAEILATVDVEAFTVQLRSDGIVHSHTHGDIEFDIESLKKFTIEMGKLTHNKKAPLLLTLDDFAIPPVDTREYWALKDSCPYASAEAYITSSIGHKLIGNFYLKLNKPGRPTRLFTNKNEAIKWLRTFL